MSDSLLKRVYSDPSKPGSLAGLQNFYRGLKDKPKRRVIKQWMASDKTYTLHRKSFKQYPRNKVIAYDIDNIWQIDLCDMQNIKNFNHQIKYLITCIDIFYAWVVPIPNKLATTVVTGLKKIIGERKPDKIQTDEGKEFLNKEMEAYLFENDIQLYVLRSEMKASVIERYNRTLKEKMYRYFTFSNTKRYKDVLSDIVSSYNNSYHRSIKMAPIEVVQENKEQVRRNLYGLLESQLEKPIFFKFDIGDYVRISKYKNIFQKGYDPNWSREVFEIHEKLPRIPPVYKIKDLEDEEVLGVFYEQELQKVNFEKSNRIIDTIVDTRQKNKKKKFLVHWLNYQRSWASWLNENELLHYTTK